MKKETPALENWRKSWENTKWVCCETGESLTITPEMVKIGACYSFGNSYVDLGDEYYGRMGGNPKKVEG